MKNRNLIYAILFLSIGFFPFLKSRYRAMTMRPAELNFTATDGSPVDLSKMRGKVVLIDFWATWCGPCMEEVPNVVATYNQLHEQGFEVVGVSLDQDRGALDRVTREKGMVWPQYFDGQGWSNAIAQKFGIQSIPAMWLIDKNGKLADTNGREDLENKVARLLAK